MSRKAWKELSGDQLNVLYTKYKRGEIAEMFGVTHDAVRFRVKYFKLRKKKPSHPDWVKITLPIIRGMVADDMNYSQIGSLFGVTKSAVAGKVYWLKQKRALAVKNTKDKTK